MEKPKPNLDPLNLTLMKLSPENILKVEKMRESLISASYFLANGPSNREMSLAKTKLEEALMWAVKAYCVDSKGS